MRATQVTRAPMSKTYYVYILASKRNGTLYIGITGNLLRRVWEHREGLVPGFTKTYGVKRLVYYEFFRRFAMRFVARRDSRSINASGRST